MTRRRRRAIAFVAVIALVVVVAVLLTRGGGGQRTPAIVHQPRASPGSGAEPSPAGQPIGANLNGLFNYNLYSPAALDRQVRALAATGATIARTDALWEATEPAPPSGGIHHYAWAFDDQIVSVLAAHRIQWLPILDYSVPWARSVPGEDHSAPRDLAAFAAWGAALAARYGAGGTFWAAHPSLAPLPVGTIEVWNEPDNPAFWNPTDAAVYADLYAGTRDAVSAVDPTAQVIVGGLVNPGKFMGRMLRAKPDLRGHIDGISIHPYGPTPLHVLSRLRAERRALAAEGLGSVPLYVTEFGWATHPDGAPAYAPATARPGYISETIRALGHTDCGVAAVTVYTWVTRQKNPDDREDWFGIAPPAGGPSADVSAFADGIREARAPGPTLKLCGS